LNFFRRGGVCGWLVGSGELSRARFWVGRVELLAPGVVGWFWWVVSDSSRVCRPFWLAWACRLSFGPGVLAGLVSGEVGPFGWGEYDFCGPGCVGLFLVGCMGCVDSKSGLCRPFLAGRGRLLRSGVFGWFGQASRAVPGGRVEPCARVCRLLWWVCRPWLVRGGVDCFGGCVGFVFGGGASRPFRRGCVGCSTVGGCRRSCLDVVDCSGGRGRHPLCCGGVDPPVPATIDGPADYHAISFADIATRSPGVES